MVRKGVLLTVAVLLSVAGIAQAGGWQPLTPTRDNIGIQVGATYLTRYIWYGIDLYGDNHSAIQPFVNLDLWGTGWTLATRWTRPNGANYENWEQLDYTLAYGGACGDPESTWYKPWQVGWRYYNHPDGPMRYSDGCTQDLDRQEFFGTFSWPNLCSAGFVPSYTLIYVKPEESGRKSNPCCTCSHQGNSYWRQGGGFVHVFGITKDVPIMGFSSISPEQVLTLGAQAIYNDSMGGRNVDHDWSHINWSAQTDVKVNENTTLTPGIVYQTTMDKSVNSSDEWWAFLTLTILCN